jgi:hypothetical protein
MMALERLVSKQPSPLPRRTLRALGQGKEPRASRDDSSPESALPKSSITGRLCACSREASFGPAAWKSSKPTPRFNGVDGLEARANAMEGAMTRQAAVTTGNIRVRIFTPGTAGSRCRGSHRKPADAQGLSSPWMRARGRRAQSHRQLKVQRKSRLYYCSYSHSPDCPAELHIGSDQMIRRQKSATQSFGRMT